MIVNKQKKLGVNKNFSFILNNFVFTTIRVFSLIENKIYQSRIFNLKFILEKNCSQI